MVNHLTDSTKYSEMVAVIGGGPAGLMASEILLRAGKRVSLFDGKPSLGRKLLVAGSSGLNLTHTGEFSDFLDRYGQKREWLEPILRQFTPDDLRIWVESFGIKTFVGSSGKIFPQEMTAGKFLNLWLARLTELGLSVYREHYWLGWNKSGELRFNTSLGEKFIKTKTLVLALGGASWPQTGSDGQWFEILSKEGIPLSPFRPANCGFEVKWSNHLKDKFAGVPVKNVDLSVIDLQGVRFTQRGEFVITTYGVEGSLVYAAGSRLRDLIEKNGYAEIYLDLLPDWTKDKLVTQLSKPRGKRSLSSFLERIGINGSKLSLLWEIVPREEMNDPVQLVEWIKALPLHLNCPRPIEEAISTAGGVCFEGLTENLMIKNKPGVFCAGEMLDWEAPTGGYLINACLATGRWAGKGVLEYIG
ncbi:MAG: aminoacetone oxidase family FAD-binding enzyme [Anaerolineaceae bacterium]|nr:aminoacetone oxidase family FAD-binding enzyme [Anaerolineaceae bacterium]